MKICMYYQYFYCYLMWQICCQNYTSKVAWLMERKPILRLWIIQTSQQTNKQKFMTSKGNTIRLIYIYTDLSHICRWIRFVLTGEVFLDTKQPVCSSLQGRHNECDGVSNHQPRDCLLNRLFRRRSNKHQSSASLAFVRGIHRWPMNSLHKGPVTRKMF